SSQALSFAWLAGMAVLASIGHPRATLAADCPSTVGQPIPVGTGAVDLRTGVGRDLLIGLPDGVVRLDRVTGQVGDEIPLAGPAHLMVAGHGFIWTVDGIDQRIQRIGIRGRSVTVDPAIDVPDVSYATVTGRTLWVPRRPLEGGEVLRLDV